MAAEDDSDIPDSGAVFTFGKSKFADNLPNKFWVRNDRVLQVACGDEHTALVAESGRVFTFGANDWGQLGLGTTTTADRPSCIKSLKHEKVKLVACGRVHTIVATESGKIYSFGANGEGQLGVDDSPNSNVPKCIDSLVDQQYSMLAAGADHSVALTDDGAVYVWGSGGEGQLGMGGKTECPDPEELRIEDVVTCISCGYYHTAYVTESGELYTFGESEGGKLGLGDDPDDTDAPQKVSISERVKSVACGGAHTVALTETGNVYTFGDGPSGQLGHGTHCLQSTTPRKLPINFKVQAISCGENHTCLISDKGQLYTFGDGRHGKLGLGQESFSNQFTPQRVKRFSKFNVEKVSCGGCHMICLGKLRLDNESYSSDEEILSEPKMNGLLNHSLRPDGSIDLNNSVTARDRRRKHNDSFKIDLNRTLPPLKKEDAEKIENLYKTVPVVKSQRHPVTPPKQRKINGMREDLQENEVHEEAITAVKKEETHSSPKPLPRPVPRKPATPEESEEEEEEEEEEEMKEQLVPSVHAAPVPPPRALPKRQEEEEDSEEEEEEDEEEEKQEEKKKEEAKKEKKKKVKKKKGKGLGLFGRKHTGISEDEEESEEYEEEEEEDKKEEKTAELEVEKKGKKKKEKEKKEKEKKEKEKDKKKKDKKKNKKGKKEEEDEEEEEEEEADEKDDKVKTKDKKDKKKDKKKKGKKDKEKDEEEEEEEEEEEKEKDEKEDKKKKDKKKKDKDKNKDKDKEKDKEKDKDTDKEKEDSEKEKAGEKEGEKTEEEKKDEQPPPKKKSSFCIIL